MSRLGLIAAIAHANMLPTFKSQRHATKYYNKYIKKYLKLLETMSKETDKFNMDYSIDSLKSIELWYFQLYESNKFNNKSLDRHKFEKCMAVYYGEVVVRNIEGAKWIVREDTFMPGKYEFGVTQGLFTRGLNTAFSELFKRHNNKRKQSVFREFKKYFGA